MSKRVVNDTIEEIADKMLSDIDFKNNIMQALNDISADGKIDQKDIPTIINVLVLNYNKIQKLHVTKEQIGDVLGYVCSKLLHDNNLVPEDQIQQIDDLITSAIGLVLTNPIVVSGLKKLWKKLTSCCSSTKTA
jgi:hypothetical protein